MSVISRDDIFCTECSNLYIKREERELDHIDGFDEEHRRLVNRCPICKRSQLSRGNCVMTTEIKKSDEHHRDPRDAIEDMTLPRVTGMCPKCETETIQVFCLYGTYCTICRSFIEPTKGKQEDGKTN